MNYEDWLIDNISNPIKQDRILKLISKCSKFMPLNVQVNKLNTKID